MPIFNNLAAYAEIDHPLGYTQGMNFMVAIIYVAVQDEVIAFTILQRLMTSKYEARQLKAKLPE